MNNIFVRASSGAVYVSVLIVGVLFYNQLALAVFGVLAGIGLFEFNKLMSELNYGNEKSRYVGIGLLAYLIFCLAGMSYISLLFWGLLPLLFLVQMIISLFSPKEKAVVSSMLGIAGYVYILLPLCLVHFLYSSNKSGEILDFWPVLGMMILTWTSDTFAYLSGRFFGKTKLFERISPKKTWEGVAGGVLFSLIAATIIYFADDNRPLYFWLVLGAIVPVFGILGDLFESLIKRTAGVKDSGDFIPGHGGILDRVDAMLFTIPTTFSWIFIYGMIK